MKFLLIFFLIISFTSYGSTNITKVPYCVDPNWMPYEGIVDGEHVGISSDYIALFSQYTGFEFELVPTASWTETIKHLKSGRCWFTTMLNQTPSRELYLDFSNTYFQSPNVLVAGSQQPFIHDLANVGDRSLAVVKEYRLAEYIEQHHPETNVIHVDSEKYGLELLLKGKVDLFASSMLFVNGRITQGEYSSLRIAGWAGPEDELKVGVIKSKPELLVAFNGAIAEITNKEHSNIVEKWSNVRVVKEIDYEFVYKVIGVIIIIVAIFIFRQNYLKEFNTLLQQKNEELELTKRRLEESNQKLQKISYVDSLTELHNRHYFSKNIDDEIKILKRHKSSATLIIIDIDFFKEINDNFGHSIGDEVLKNLGQIFISKIRETDIAARWGGDEFIFLLRHSNAVSAMILAERIREAVLNTDFKQVGKVTLSIGMSDYQDDEAFLSWYERADKALYEAKRAGRNQIKAL